MLGIWLVVVYLLVTLLIASWRLLRLPRYPGACLGVIGISLFLTVYERYLMMAPSVGDFDFSNEFAAFFGLVFLIPIQLVLLVFAVARHQEQDADSQSSTRFRLITFRESFLGRSKAEKSKEL